jgi:L-ribulose-5-phosphate 3-epimerase
LSAGNGRLRVDSMNPDRRSFLTAAAALATSTAGGLFSACSKNDAGIPQSGAPGEGPLFRISLAQWSLHRALKEGKLDNLDYPKFTKETFGIDAIEWVNQFFFEEHATFGYQPKVQGYLVEMKKRVEDLGMTSVLIMCDRVGNLGHPETGKRNAAVEGHFAWLEAAKLLGCHCIRVNAASDPTLNPEKQSDLCTEGLRHLSEKAATMGLGVIVENHGGLSSNGAWLAQVIKNVGLDNCGTLPDFGNFYVVKNRGDATQYEKDKALYAGDPAYTEDAKGLAYDRYLGTAELMPHARGVSAKAHDFDAQGNETHTDFLRMMGIVKAAGYRGFVGIEYEGDRLGEVEGIRKTKDLLERVFAQV